MKFYDWFPCFIIATLYKQRSQIAHVGQLYGTFDKSKSAHQAYLISTESSKVFYDILLPQLTLSNWILFCYYDAIQYC